MRPFFSRRIGIGSSNPIPIIAGARLSGKPNKNWRIGLMDIQTAKTRNIPSKRTIVTKGANKKREVYFFTILPFKDTSFVIAIDAI